MSIDITQDLVDGSEGVLGDAMPVDVDNAPASGAGEGDQKAYEGDAVDLHSLPPKQSEEDLSLRDNLSNAFAPKEDAEDTPAPEVTQLTKGDDGKYRTPLGQFATKEEIEAFEASQAAPDTSQQQPAPFESVLSGMTPVEQEQFKALPEETRQYVGRTIEALNDRASRYTEYDQLEQVLGPRREIWGQQGITPAMAINQVLTLSEFATRDPANFVLWFAENNGIDLDAVLDQHEASQHGDPLVRNLQGQVAQLTQTLQQQQGNSQQQQHEANVRMVENFAQEKDEGGNLKHPYFAEVTPMFASFVQATRQSNPTMPSEQVLQQAYESACYANPTVRAKIQADEALARRKETAAAVQAKKQAAGSITGGPAGSGIDPSQLNNGNMSIRETLSAAFAEHG